MHPNNHFTSPKAIRATFRSAGEKNRHAGVPVYAAPGELRVDDSHRHVQVIGNTGEGKTQCVVLPFARDCFHKNENLILLNCKDECYRELACHVPAHYQKFCVNFSDLQNSPNCWNPFRLITDLYQTELPSARDQAAVICKDFCRGLLCDTTFDESFWPESAADFLMGLTFALMETAFPEQVNLESINSMMIHGEEKFGAVTYTKAFYSLLQESRLSKANLSGYFSAPNVTRMSIFSTARRGLAQFGLSQGLRDLLMQDNLDIFHLDVERPFAFFIIMPQGTDTRSTLAALLVEQLMAHLTFLANRRPDRRLPIRTHVVLEELSKVGRCVPSLPGLLATGRSLGLRLMLVLQSSDQLTEIYGPARAAAINACIGLSICFSSSCSATLRKWSDDCGETLEEVNGSLHPLPLISPTELRAMDVGEALIFTKNAKFRTRLPFYYQLTANHPWQEPAFRGGDAVRGEGLDFLEHVKAMKRREITTRLQSTPAGVKELSSEEPVLRRPTEEEPSEEIFCCAPTPAEVNRLFERRKGDLSMPDTAPKRFKVTVLNPGSNTKDVAKTVSVMLSIPYKEAMKRLHSQEELVSISFSSRHAAENAKHCLAQEGATAVVLPVLHPEQ